VAVWRPGDNGEVAVGTKLIRGDARARREEEDGGGGCGGGRRGSSPFIGVEGGGRGGDDGNGTA
jgi:hypothetical protein